MKIEEVKAQGLKKEFKVTISAKDFEKQVEDKLVAISKTAKIQGFRAGKAPMSMLKQKYRAGIIGEVLENTVQNGVGEVLKKNKLQPALHPDVKITSFADGKDLEFDITVEVLPEIKVEDFSKIALTKLDAEVPAEEVEKALNYLSQSRKSSTKISTDRAAQKGDVVVIDFVGSVDGTEFQGGKGNDYKLELGSNSFIPGFEDQLIGKKAGSSVDVNVDFPKEYHAKELAGKPSLFKVDIKEIQEYSLVEINDDFAKNLGAKDLNEIKSSISERIKGDYNNASKMKVKRQLLDALDKAYSFDVPEGLVSEEFKAIKAQYEEAKKNNQLDANEKDKKEADLLKEYQDIASRRVKLGLLLSEVGKTAKISVEADDVNKAILEEAKKYPGQEKAVFDYYLKNKQAIDSLRAPIFEEKIIEHILSQCKVDTKIVSVEELYNFDEEAPKAKKASTKKAS